ncbi:TetR/AcrR family transcriptional regulator [Natranaerofaba carboxydovora]|uniref:TetR/AcrR family transcriptional regulator n=1 Tax=Natranaerofaba carboxydovora TaxID=2742683 RepID=UPI001F144C52|nr:TetR/AcrR family transcriptional regulator [Natranaerofaba carboxydovora]UMZ74828.1 Fatty acid metabolism regulator protein [Natranaerofaba carboxydovora]
MSKNLPSEVRKSQVTNAFIECLLENGYDNFSVKDIAKKAGVSTGILYHYFSGKEDIIVAALKESFSSTDRKVLNIVEENDDPEEKLTLFINYIGKMVKEDEQTFKIAVNYLGQVLHNDSITDLMAKFFDNIRSFTTNTLENTISDISARSSEINTSSNDETKYSDKTEVNDLNEKTINSLSTIFVAFSIGLGIQYMVDKDEKIDLEDCTRLMEKFFSNELKS